MRFHIQTLISVVSYCLVAADCGRPPNVEHSYQVGRIYIENYSVLYVCDQCFRGGGVTICQYNGEWTLIPTCRGEYIQGGGVTICQYNVEWIQIHTWRGEYTQGGGVTICQYNVKWTQIPTCRGEYTREGGVTIRQYSWE